MDNFKNIKELGIDNKIVVELLDEILAYTYEGDYNEKYKDNELYNTLFNSYYTNNAKNK